MLYEPTKEDVFQRRVTITTCITARILADIGVPRGYFSHIFMDEAGQALVCEALVPFSLCDANTRVILAGDPKQVIVLACPVKTGKIFDFELFFADVLKGILQFRSPLQLRLLSVGVHE